LAALAEKSGGRVELPATVKKKPNFSDFLTPALPLARGVGVTAAGKLD
jgi:hypothetical protein